MNLYKLKTHGKTVYYVAASDPTEAISKYEIEYGAVHKVESLNWEEQIMSTKLLAESKNETYSILYNRFIL